MDSNGLVGGMEVETILQVGHDEFGRLVELHLLHHFLHAVQTGTLATEHGILTLLRSFPEGGFEFGTLTVGDVEHTLRLPDLAAAHLLHTFREDDFVACLCHQLDDLIDKGVLERRFF